MPKIIAPNKQFNGESAGVNFRDGEGECNDAWRLQWFKEHGYDVVEDKKEVKQEKKVAEAKAEAKSETAKEEKE